MRRENVFLVVVGTVSMVGWLGCGGSTTGSFTNGGSDDAGVDGTASTLGAGGANGEGAGGGTTGGGGDAGQAGSAGGGPFDPGGIGDLLGGQDGGSPEAGIPGGPIRPEVVDGCDALCAKEATANCPNQDTVSSCVLGCRLILNKASCAAQTNALFACEKTSTVACDDKGKATLAQCPGQELAAAGCFLQNSMDPSLTAPCSSYCAGVASAHCLNDDPAASCPGSCQVVGTLAPACTSAWKTYIACASGATFTCGNDGKAGAAACGLQFATFAVCAYGGALDTGDAGR
jgi:hypothetical protein